MVEINAKRQRVIESGGGEEAETEKYTFFLASGRERLDKKVECLFVELQRLVRWVCTEEKQKMQVREYNF